MIIVYNKIDKFRDREFKNTGNRAYVSAIEGRGIEGLRDILAKNN